MRKVSKCRWEASENFWVENLREGEFVRERERERERDEKLRERGN